MYNIVHLFKTSFPGIDTKHHLRVFTKASISKPFLSRSFSLSAILPDLSIFWNKEIIQRLWRKYRWCTRFLEFESMRFCCILMFKQILFRIPIHARHVSVVILSFALKSVYLCVRLPSLQYSSKNLVFRFTATKWINLNVANITMLFAVAVAL